MINRTALIAAIESIEANPDALPLVYIVPVSKEAVSRCAFTAEEIEERCQAALEKTLKACLSETRIEPPV